MTDPTQAEVLAGREYRKTATIRATQWWQDGDHPAVIRKTVRNRYADEGIPWCPTLEGGHVVTPGDWIATGVHGEHWPIKPDVFAATYEAVTPTPSTSVQGDGEAGEIMREARLWVERNYPAAVDTNGADRLVAAFAAGTALSPPAPASVADGEWFYPEGDHSSDECRFSPDEVIDYALEGEAVSRVVCIERAASLPSVYAAVRVWSDAEKDERQSDDDYDYTLHATAEEARAALTEGTPS
jgi:hypothetical protein